MINMGEVRRWINEDGILYAENDFVLLTWAPTDDPEMDGKFAFYGPKQIGVELMLRSKFELLIQKIKR